MPHKSVEDLIEVLKKCPESTRVMGIHWEAGGAVAVDPDATFDEYLKAQPRHVTIEVMTNVVD